MLRNLSRWNRLAVTTTPTDTILARFDRNGSIIMLYYPNFGRYRRKKVAPIPTITIALMRRYSKNPEDMLPLLSQRFWRIYMQASMLSILTKYQ